VNNQILTVANFPNLPVPVLVQDSKKQPEAPESQVNDVQTVTVGAS
jgi:hypothetical protein